MKNNIYTNKEIMGVPVTATARHSSGDPIQVGRMNGVLVGDPAATTYAAVADIAQNVYQHQVRNVTAFNGGNEQTYGAITKGEVIYYDAVSEAAGKIPEGVFLTTSAENTAEAATLPFGLAMTADSTATANTATIDVLTIQTV